MKKNKYKSKDNNKYKKDIQDTVKVKNVKLPILKLEDNSAIVKLNGWRKRVYFNLSKKDKKKLKKGMLINIRYEGDIKDVHTVKFLSLDKI